GVVLAPSFASCPEVNAVALHRDGQHLATACKDGTVRVRDLDTGQSVWGHQGHATEAADVAYSPDGRWLAAAAGRGKYGAACAPSERAEAKLWEAGTGAEIRTFPAVQGASSRVAFSPDSRWLASGWGDGIVRIWDTKDPTGKVRELPKHIGGVSRV